MPDWLTNLLTNAALIAAVMGGSLAWQMFQNWRARRAWERMKQTRPAPQSIVVIDTGYFMRSVGPQICSRCGKPHYEPTDTKRKKP